MKWLVPKLLCAIVSLTFAYDAVLIHDKFNNEANHFKVTAKVFGPYRSGTKIRLFDGQEKYTISCSNAKILCNQLSDLYDKEIEFVLLSTSIIEDYFIVEANIGGKKLIDKANHKSLIEDRRNSYILGSLVALGVFISFFLLRKNRA